jgi:bacterioferritin-associated ferredoxin
MVVDAIIELGLRTVREVRSATGAGTGCTCCHQQIRELLEAHVTVRGHAVV